ncbi:mannitol dehydrogenase [Marinomonas sp. 15G1-11]|uniref:Mannitol dehydrogenase n=1 Tax=Marinomonas phaeophyticola TaxID=3004091 RepID=A0ABT4JRH4_9GAMM|nr:mannitol dehydrogenase [Marinomonas sp. 15G1-11]MCZ2720985.1 mannitol dehydrogenase [Marinomonas sp. 15G1-11]
MNDGLIMQFGTSRFLQAHVDFFVGESIAQGHSNSKVVVVQTSNSLAGKMRLKAFQSNATYPVKIQGLKLGKIVNQTVQVQSIETGFQADSDWSDVVSLFCQRVTHVVSNTADQGYLLEATDSLDLSPPASFPAKLLVLLFARFKDNAVPVTIMPCELVVNNGDVLKNLVLNLAAQWALPPVFLDWLQNRCLWINSLVDRIVSESIEPIGAVAEPYALWAIEDQPGLVLPCQHDAIRVLDNLEEAEFLKLGVLNLSHTYLVDTWRQLKRVEATRPEMESIHTVVQAMENPLLRHAFETVLAEEVVPVLLAMNLNEEVIAYVDSVRERFLNPFLQHNLSDIEQNHQSKIERRISPVVSKAQRLLPSLKQPKLVACMVRNQVQMDMPDDLELEL